MSRRTPSGPSGKGLPPTAAMKARARAHLTALARAAGYPLVPATGAPAHGWQVAVAAQLGVSPTFLRRVWVGTVRMPGRWIDRES